LDSPKAMAGEGCQQRCSTMRAAVVGLVAMTTAGAILAAAAALVAFSIPTAYRRASLRATALRQSAPAHSTIGMPDIPAASAVAGLAFASAVVAAGSRRQNQPRRASLSRSLALATARHMPDIWRAGNYRMALKAWPWENDDPYSKCSAVKLQVGLVFSKALLDALNGLAESADTSSDEGLHTLLLDVMLALRRAESSWRYGSCERQLFDIEDEGRAAGAALQRWGIEGQSKWGDGEDWEKMGRSSAPSGSTEYLVITVLVSCYGTVGPSDSELKVRSITDVKKTLDALSGIQVDELMQLDVQWIPEEAGDSLSAMELTMKFPELSIL